MTAPAKSARSSLPDGGVIPTQAQFVQEVLENRHTRAIFERFLVKATCVGLRPGAAGWELHAPHGLAALYEGRLSPNPLTNHRRLFEQKAASCQWRWPWLRIDTDG